jgi:undecaprenyl-diphosphatase
VLAAFTLLVFFLTLWLLFALSGEAIERILAKAAHWTAHFRYGDYVPVLLVIAGGIAAAIAAGNAFLEVAEQVQSRSTALNDLDAALHQWAASRRAPGFTRLFGLATALGSPVILSIITVSLAMLLLTRGHWRWSLFLVLTGAIGGLLNLQLKAYFARSRPELAEALTSASGFAFPSGHAMGSTIVFGSFCYIALRTIGRWRWRGAVFALCSTVILLISASRVYLGVHWISDVGAGIAAGTLWVISATVAYETFRRIRLVRALRTRRTEESQSLKVSKSQR